MGKPRVNHHFFSSSVFMQIKVITCAKNVVQVLKWRHRWTRTCRKVMGRSCTITSNETKREVSENKWWIVWLISIAGVGFWLWSPDWNVCNWDRNLSLGWWSFPKMGTVTIWERDPNPSPSPCNENMFCIILCSHRVWNPNPSSAVEISHHWNYLLVELVNGRGLRFTYTWCSSPNWILIVQ